MADTTHKGYGSIQTALSTELNSLASAGVSSASSAIDNTSALALFMDVELVVAAQGAARSTGASVTIQIVQALDGTNYGDVNATTAEILAVFALDAATTARRAVVRDIPIPPGLFQIFAVNGTGQALASSGNTVKYRTHSVQTV